MTLRYFQCADGENERTFVAPGKVATGDMGRLDADGNLYLLGRKKELLITPGGLKIHPESIEQELNNCPDVVHSVIFMRPDAAHLTCVVDLVQPGERRRQGAGHQIRQQPAHGQESRALCGSDLRRRAFHHGKRHAAAQPEDRPQGDRRALSLSVSRQWPAAAPCGSALRHSQTMAMATTHSQAETVNMSTEASR